LPIGVIWYGVVLGILWSWFIAPVFTAPELSILQAVGLSVVVNFIVFIERDEDNTEKELWSALIVAIIRTLGRPLMALITGFIVQLFL
jgi:hypothetical protein